MGLCSWRHRKIMSSSIAQNIDALCQEQGIERDLVIEAMKEAVREAAKKQFRSGEDIQVDWNPETGIELSATKVVVNHVTNEATELSLDEARELAGEGVELGDVLLLPLPMEEIGRIAAQTAKQILFQKVSDAGRSKVYEQYIEKIGDLVNGYVKRFERGNIIVDLGNLEAILPRSQQSRGEQWNQDERIRVVINNVSKESKGPQVEVSRTSPELLLRLFEMEVPEIYVGTVVIKSAVREPGERAKIAVTSNERDVDPVGACVGMKGSRVQAIIRELRGEKIDIIEWSDEPSVFAANALSPAKVNQVRITDAENQQMEVIVNEDQLALAFGNRGQNVRLATKLVGWEISLRSEEGVYLVQTPLGVPPKSVGLTQHPGYEVVFSIEEDLTPDCLKDLLLPYLKAVSDIQRVIDEVKGDQPSDLLIKSIKQASPVSVNLDGVSDAIRLITETVVPWRRKHAEAMCVLIEEEKKAEIEIRKAEIKERRAHAVKDRAEAERMSAEASKQREEAHHMKLKNEQLRIQLDRERIQLALDLLAQISPELSEGEKIAYAIKLLPALGVVTSTEIEILSHS